MRLIEKIKYTINKTNGVTLASVCRGAEVNYQTVWRALNDGRDIKESTLMKLCDYLDKNIVLIDKEL